MKSAANRNMGSFRQAMKGELLAHHPSKTQAR